MFKTPIKNSFTALAAVPVATAVTLILLAGGCGGGGSSPSAPPAPSPRVVTVQILDDRFSPMSVTINPGDTVQWVLRGTHPGHTVTTVDGAFSSGAVFQNDGDTFMRTFPATEAGQTFEYYCQTHRACCQMQGSVRVGQNAPQPGPGY